MANQPDEASPHKPGESGSLSEAHASSDAAEKSEKTSTPKPEAGDASKTSVTPTPASGTVARQDTAAATPALASGTPSTPKTETSADPYGGEIGSVTTHAGADTEHGYHSHEHQDDWHADQDHHHHGSHEEDPYHHHDEYQHHNQHEEGAYSTAGALVPVTSGGGGRGGSSETDPDAKDDGEGGPIKGFLEHLEDLRWMLIKCASVIGVATLICLLGGSYITNILMYPLRQAATIPERFLHSTNSVISVNLGTNSFGPFRVKPEVLGGLAITNERFVSLDLEIVQIGTNNVLGIRSRPTPESERKPEIDVRIFTPAGGFVIAFKVAMYAGVLISSPFLLWFIGQFVFPALKLNEKKFITRAILIGTFLFLSGVAFCFFVLMPFALNASVAYSEWLGFGANQWRAEEYISFVCKFMLGMGLGFEMPVVILTLVKIGILDYATLKKLRPYMIVINLVLGAVLTTPEVLTQVLMAVPLQILFEVSVLITWYWERKERKRQEREAPLGL